MQNQEARFDLARTISDRSRRALPCDRSRRPGVKQTKLPETALVRIRYLCASYPIFHAAAALVDACSGHHRAARRATTDMGGSVTASLSLLKDTASKGTGTTRPGF